jgi:hypothetical protein
LLNPDSNTAACDALTQPGTVGMVGVPLSWEYGSMKAVGLNADKATPDCNVVTHEGTVGMVGVPLSWEYGNTKPVGLNADKAAPDCNVVTHEGFPVSVDQLMPLMLVLIEVTLASR